MNQNVLFAQKKLHLRIIICATSDTFGGSPANTEPVVALTGHHKLTICQMRMVFSPLQKLFAKRYLSFPRGKNNSAKKECLFLRGKSFPRKNNGHFCLEKALREKIMVISVWKKLFAKRKYSFLRGKSFPRKIMVIAE